MFLGGVDGQKVVLFALDSRGKWLAGMLKKEGLIILMLFRRISVYQVLKKRYPANRVAHGSASSGVQRYFSRYFSENKHLFPTVASFRCYGAK